MGIEYGRAYDGDTFSKLITDLGNIIERKTKRKDKVERIIPWPNETDDEKIIFEFISQSTIEGKDLQILYDRLVQLVEKLE